MLFPPTIPLLTIPSQQVSYFIRTIRKFLNPQVILPDFTSLYEKAVFIKTLFQIMVPVVSGAVSADAALISLLDRRFPAVDRPDHSHVKFRFPAVSI